MKKGSGTTHFIRYRIRCRHGFNHDAGFCGALAGVACGPADCRDASHVTTFALRTEISKNHPKVDNYTLVSFKTFIAMSNACFIILVKWLWLSWQSGRFQNKVYDSNPVSNKV